MLVESLSRGRRTFWIPFLLLLALVAVLVVQFWQVSSYAQQAMRKAITDATQAATATATRVFINESYPSIAGALGLEGDNRLATAGLSGEALEQVDRAVRRFMLGTDILKIKIYALNGMTLYSTELAQVGEDKSSSTLVMSAAQGITASQITHRDRFEAVAGEVFDKDLVATYLPIRSTTSAVIGVAEVYVDRTPALEYTSADLAQAQGLLLVFQALVLVLVLVLAWSFWAHRTGMQDSHTP